MTNASSPCIIVEAADKVIVQCVGENSLTYTAASADYDGAIYAKDDLTVNGSGSLSITSALHGIVCKDDLKLTGAALSISAGSIGLKANDSVRIGGGTISMGAGHDGIQVKSDDGTGYFYMEDGALTVTAGYDGVDVGADESDGADAAEYSGYVLICGGTVSVTAGGGSSQSKNAGTSQKGIKCDGNLLFAGAIVNVRSTNNEGIESKGTITINDGEVYSYSQSDDAINSASTFTINGGYVCGHSAGNDGLDANGNFYIKGGVVYAIGKQTPEVAVDANTEQGYRLYVEGGTIIAIGGLERGSSLTQNCYQASSWSKNTWYALTVGSTTYAFKTPSSGGSSMVVSGSSTPTLRSGVTATEGTSHFMGTFFSDPTVSGGTNVNLSTYTGNGGGGWPH